MAKICKAFILTVLVFCMFPAVLAENFISTALNEKERYAMNLFLSNFTEVGVEKIDLFSDAQVLVDFAHDHMWFNDYESYEYGKYAGDNNCRVSDDRIPEIIDSFFGDVGEVDLSQTRFDYDGEYYYHCETGGWSNSGFAYTVNVCPIGNDTYFVSFLNFEGLEPWENDVLDDALDAIIEKYGDPIAYGSAIIYAEDLVNRSTYKIISYTLV